MKNTNIENQCEEGISRQDTDNLPPEKIKGDRLRHGEDFFFLDYKCKDPYLRWVRSPMNDYGEVIRILMDLILVTDTNATPYSDGVEISDLRIFSEKYLNTKVTKKMIDSFSSCEGLTLREYHYPRYQEAHKVLYEQQ